MTEKKKTPQNKTTTKIKNKNKLKPKHQPTKHQNKQTTAFTHRVSTGARRAN